MITLVTRQNLLAEKTRFFMSVGGIALAVFLISFLLSLYQGWNLSVGRFVENVDADAWVAREGTTDFLNAASILPESMETDIEENVPGVAAADPLVVRPLSVEVDGEPNPVHLVGYRDAGGPPSIEKGADTPGDGEIIIDSAFSKTTGLGIGDTMYVVGEPQTIVGISGGGNLVFSQTVFVPLETAQRLLTMDGLVTFYLLHLEDGADADATAEAAKAHLGAVEAFSSSEFADSTRERIMSNMIPILIVILALAFVVGVAITGLTIYTAAVEKSREYGILKALGFTNGYLIRLVLEQSMITSLLGFAIGAVLTALAATFISDLVPQFVTLLRWQDVLLVLGTTLLMGVLAAILPVRRVAGVDPVTVFSA